MNLSFRFEESKQYQSYPARLPSTLERRAVLGEGTLYFAQTTDRISKKQQTALVRHNVCKFSCSRPNIAFILSVCLFRHPALNKIQCRIHRRYYPKQYLFEIRYHQTVLHDSLMELFGWGGDKPRLCLRIGLQSHLRALQKHMVSCQTAPGTLICNLQACCGLFLFKCTIEMVPSSVVVPERSISHHSTDTIHQTSFPFVLCFSCSFADMILVAPLTKAAHYTYSLEFS